MKNRISPVSYTLATGITLVTTAISQYIMGRVVICKCGYIKLWHGLTQSSENSQHIADWYTFSHIIHGFAFYYFGKVFLKKLSVFQWFIVALIIEAGWELIENSSVIIDRYRTTTISLDYYGDSILNSLCDILAMVVGFYFAKRFPLWIILLLTIVMEVFVGYMIRDNLTFNIIMLIYPFEFIKRWQLGV